VGAALDRQRAQRLVEVERRRGGEGAHARPEVASGELAGGADARTPDNPVQAHPAPVG